MDKMLLKRTAVQSVALMIAVITISYALKQYSHTIISATDIKSAEAASLIPEEENITPTADDIPDRASEEAGQQNGADAVKESSGLPGMLKDVDTDIVKQLGDKYLVIRKPSVAGIKMDLQDIYITKSINLIFSSTDAFQMNSDNIGRVNGKNVYIGNPSYSETNVLVTDPEDGTTTTVVTKDYGQDTVHGISFTNPELSKNIIELTLELDTVYVHSIKEDETYYYISLKKPSEVYDRVLVLDAGHGGKDAGALSKDESVYEKNVNLGILLEVKKLLDKENIKVYYTRLGDDKVFLRPRVELANAVDCDYFISIHSNASGSTKPSGTEIFYYATEFKQVSSKALATIFSEEIEKTTTLTNRGLVSLKKDDVYILNHSNVPAILIESGYMTNLNDLNYLKEKENQEAIAKGIYNGILRAYEELPVKDK